MTVEDELRSGLDAAREMRPTRREVEQVISRIENSSATRPSRSLPTPVLVGAAAALLLAGTVAGVPTVRAALSDVGDYFASYFEGEGGPAAPGRALRASDTPPEWLTADTRHGQRLLAENGGFELYVVQEPSGAYGFALDNQVGISDSARGWQRQFDRNDVVILGPGTRPDAEGAVPLYGVSSGGVERVEVRYDVGLPTEVEPTRGGFIVRVDPTRKPMELVASGGGQAIQTLDLAYIDWQGLADRNPS